MNEKRIILHVLTLKDDIQRCIAKHSNVGMLPFINEHISHELDCQLYGSMYRQYSKETFTSMLDDFKIPTDIRLYLQNHLQAYMEDMLARYLGPPDPRCSYTAEWVGDNTCIITTWVDREQKQ